MELGKREEARFCLPLILPEMLHKHLVDPLTQVASAMSPPAPPLSLELSCHISSFRIRKMTVPELPDQ